MNKSTEGLRDLLFQELAGFLAGELDSSHVKTVTRLTGAILATVAKDMEAAALLKDLNLGRDQPRTLSDLNLNLLLSSNK